MAPSSKSCITVRYNYQNGTHTEEIYAYDGKHQYDHWVSEAGVTTFAIYDLQSNTKNGYFKTPFGKYKTKGPIPVNDLTKGYQILVDREKRKEILGYDCFSVKIVDDQRKSPKSYVLYVTDHFTQVPIMHKLQRMYPKLEFLPLEVKSNTYTCEAIEILEEVDQVFFSVNEEEYKPAAENNYSIVKKLTGYSLKDFKKMLKDKW